MIISNKTLAWYGVAGTLCDAVGGLYLTYDLLGGSRGPLGLITRAATYGILFSLGYGLAFGPAFGAIAGLGLGGLLAFEFWSLAHHQRIYGHSPLHSPAPMGIWRGLILGAAALPRFGWRFSAVFGGLNAIFLFVLFRLRYGSTHEYQAAPVLKLSAVTRRASFLRALAIGASGAAAGWFEGRRAHAAALGMTIGLTVGLVSFVVGTISPVVEWRVEHLPERVLAAMGFALIAAGMVLQSVQYAAVIVGR